MAKGHKIYLEGEREAEAIAEGILKGGSGSGNFGHAGRPGQVGGSAEGTSGDAGLTGDITKPLFNKAKMLDREARYQRDFVRDVLKNLTEHPEEFDRKPSDPSYPMLRDLIIGEFQRRAGKMQKHPRLAESYLATASVLGYKNASSDEAAKKAMAIMVQQFNGFLEKH